MLPEIVEVVRAFEVADQVLFSQLNSSTAVLIPENSGSAVIVQDRGDTITVRTGLDVSVNIDPEEEDFAVLLRDLLAALRDGKAEERLATVYRNRLAPDGYKVEYASGSMQEFGERSGREYAVRLPAWNAS